MYSITSSLFLGRILGPLSYGLKDPSIARAVLFTAVNLGAEPGTDEGSARRDLIACEEEEEEEEEGQEGSPIIEPYVGMEFESEDAAKDFYDEYSRRVGFVMRIDQCRRSEVDKRILSRRLSCNKQGFYVKARDVFGPVRKPRSSSREGCKSMMLVKVDKSGKWVVTRFVKDHTHPLIVSSTRSFSPNAMDNKDRRIQELTMELERQDQLCEVYRGLLIRFLNNVEEHTEQLSSKVEVVVNSVIGFESDVQQLSQNQ